jgi:hypothetical protein
VKILRGWGGNGLVPSLKKEYNGDRHEICLSVLGPEEKVIKCRQLMHWQNFSSSWCRITNHYRSFGSRKLSVSVGD